MAELNVQQQQIISELKRAYPELASYSDEQILSIYNQKLDELKLSEDEQISIMSGNSPTFSQTGLALEKQPIKLTSEQETQLKEVLKQRINSVTAKTKEAEDDNSWFGKAWSWTKNTFGFGDSSDKIREAQKEELEALESGNISEAFTKITGLEYTEDNLNKFLNNEISTKSEQALEGYKEGQDMAPDIFADIVSGIAAVCIYTAAVAAAPFTGGASIAVGVAAAGASGALIKAGVKALDTVGTDKKYDSFGHDLATGAFSGVLAPITGGLGGAVGKTVATKVGVQAVKQVGKEVAEEAAKGGIKQGLKTALTNPTGYEYVGGNLAKRSLAMGAEMATDGALGGAIDGGFRAGLENDWDADAILNGTLSGGIGGAIGAPVIGGGMKATGKGAQKLFGKNNVHVDAEGNIVNKKALELGNISPKYLEVLGDFEPATSARELIKQLKTQGIDTKNYDIKTLLKNCKTREDYQRTSILLNNLSKDEIYYARELPTIAKDTDDAVILKMLLDKDLGYNYESVLAKIKENPLLFDVYKEFIPILKNRRQDNSICVLERTIAEKLKTQEQCDAFLHLTKEYDRPIEIERLYHKGFVPENIDDAKSFMTILNYGNHYQPNKDIISVYLTLPKETRSVLDRFLNSENALDKDTCYSILENLKQEDTRDILTQFIKNSTDADDLRNKYTHVQEAFKNDELAKASIDRINRLESTGIEYNASDYSYLIHKRAVNEFEVSDPYFNRLIGILNDDTLKSKLGRVMTLDEANKWEQIYKGHQQNFVLSKLSPEMTEADVSRILREAQYLQNKEQIPLAELLLRQGGDIVLHENMWGGKLRKSSLYNSLRTKEDIDAFIKLCDKLPLEDDRLAQIYGHILDSNENIALKIEYAEKIPELLRQNLGDYISNIKNKHQADVLIELDKFLYKFRNLSSEIQFFLNYNLPKINDADTVNVIRKNLNAIIDSNDEEFKNLFMRYNDLSYNTFNFSDFIQNPNLNFANFNKIKPLHQSAFDNWIMLKSMECDSELIDILLKNKESIDNIGDIINGINPNNISLVKRLYLDDNFSKEQIADIARSTSQDNIALVEKLCADKEFPKEHIWDIARSTRKDNMAFVEKLCADKEFPKEHIGSIAWNVNKDNLTLVEKLCADKEFPKEHISDITGTTRADNIALVGKLCADKEFPKEHIAGIAIWASKNNLALVEKLCADKEFPKEYIGNIAHLTNKNNIALVEKLCTDKEFPKEHIGDIAISTRPDNIAFVEKLCTDKEFPKEHIGDITRSTRPDNIALVEKLCTDKEFPKEHIGDIARSTRPDNIAFVEKLCTDKEFPKKHIGNIAKYTQKDNIEFIEKLCADKEFIKSLNSIDSSLSLENYTFFNYAKWFKRPIEGMTKGEKRELMFDMFRYKNCHIDQNLEKYFPAVPKTDTEYLSIMKRISQSMNISMEKLASNICAEFNSTLKNLEDVLIKTDLSKLNEISLTMPQSEFIKRVEKSLENLPISEQYKIKEFYGFNIKNGRLFGYPDNYEKNINISKISDARSLKVAKEIENIIEEYKNNNYITVNDCPPLNSALKNISKLMPEMFNQINGSDLSVKMLKSLQKIIKNPKYANLSDSDKKVLTFATLLHNTDKDFGNTTDSAFDAFFIAQKFGFSPDETNKIYLIVQSSDVIEKFMGTNKNIVSKNLRGLNLSTTNRQNTFDRLAFDLKESNTFELAQMLYSAKDKDGLTRYLDKMLEARIKEMKSSDFVLPQTPSSTYTQYSTIRKVKGQDVNVVKLSNLNDFYAFIHTPECNFASGGMSRNQKFANFEAFSNISDDKIICTSYISKDKICGAADHGFIFDVPNNKQFVGMGFDIFSLGKNINDMLIEYFDTKSKIMAYGGRGEKMSHRTMISDNLKEILNISDDEYIKRLDNIKSQFANETMTIEKLTEIDPDFANAYKEFLSRDNSFGTRNNDALLRNGGWNEVLVSNPKISAIFTRDIDNIPEEYLIKAQEENLPIIILNE